MRTILQLSNLNLVREVRQLRGMLPPVLSELPEELHSLHRWVTEHCEYLEQRITQNVADLELNQDDILPDLLSVTQEVTREFYIFSQRLVSPVLRAQPSDRLSLRLLAWLHTAHPETAHAPVGLRDDEFSIWPVPERPIIYALPPAAQHGLLYLPLFFHEFGHLLYACHKPEMDDLVKGLQERIADALEPNVHRNDMHARVGETTRTIVVETWFEWTQEIFCDAVGYVLGGPAFAHAFSMYMRMRGRGEYHVPAEQLAHRPHPVTWLRARLLADLARRLGQMELGDELDRDWTSLASGQGAPDEYFGFYDRSFLPMIRGTIDDMLTEASPRRFLAPELLADARGWESSPIALLNCAWHRFQEAPEAYGEWERQAMATFLDPGAAQALRLLVSTPERPS